ncbi:MAG TPA: class A beta-lactamase-related serine hydrolase [Spirochaetes bacterium]|nr:class A beta-lactamase-related serine hydrolase [Spirochaetota bacterium]
MNVMNKINQAAGKRAQGPGPRRVWTAAAAVALALAIAAPALYLHHTAARRSLKKRFRSELETLHKRYRFPGATAAYILPDGTVEVCAAGLADRELTLPMTPRTRMLAASIGKTFVGATALSLAREGVLDLDGPIEKWLGSSPWFSRLPGGGGITLRQLLTHRAGIANHVDTEGFKRAFRERRRTPDAPLSPEELIGFVLNPEAPRTPKGRFHYSDTGYILAGLVIEAAAGRPYYDEVNKRFLAPLRLTLTSPSDRRDIPGLAAGYCSPENPFGLPAKTTLRPGLMAWHPGVEWTGGGLVSNPGDLVVWAKALYEGRAMKGDYLDMLLDAAPVESHSGKSYGIGVAVQENGFFGTTWGHSGWIPGYCSSMRYYPAYGVAVAFQINTDIGIADGSTEVFNDMERRLAMIVIKSLDEVAGTLLTGQTEQIIHTKKKRRTP